MQLSLVVAKNSRVFSQALHRVVSLLTLQGQSSQTQSKFWQVNSK